MKKLYYFGGFGTALLIIFFVEQVLKLLVSLIENLFANFDFINIILILVILLFTISVLYYIYKELIENKI